MTDQTPAPALDQIKADVSAFLSLVPQGEKIATVRGFLDTTFNAIKAVEKFAGDIAGADKKAIVLWVIDQYVHIPMVPQFIINDVAGPLIDVFVAWLNAQLTQDWFKKVVG